MLSKHTHRHCYLFPFVISLFIICFFAYNNKISIFHNNFELVFHKIVKCEEYLMIVLLTKMDGMTNMKT